MSEALTFARKNRKVRVRDEMLEYTFQDQNATNYGKISIINVPNERDYDKIDGLKKTIRRGHVVHSYGKTVTCVAAGLPKFGYRNDMDGKPDGIMERFNDLASTGDATGMPKMEVHITKKENGENAKVTSYIFPNGKHMWVFMSKNVPIVVEDETEFRRIDWSVQNENEMKRRGFVIEIADLFFRMMEGVDTGVVERLKCALEDVTLVGEIIGKHQHIVFEPVQTIKFYAIVPKMLDVPCLPMPQVESFCKDYNLSCVDYTTAVLPCDFLDQITAIQFGTDLATVGEGAVAYFTEDGKVVHITKEKSELYSELRRMRGNAMKLTNKNGGFQITLDEAHMLDGGIYRDLVLKMFVTKTNTPKLVRERFAGLITGS